MYWMRSFYPEEGVSIWCSAVRRTEEDGGYLLAGSSSAHFMTEFLIIKLEQDGSINWYKTCYHIPYSGQVTCLEVVGGYCYVGGYTFDAGRMTAVVMKMEASSGQIEWTRLYGGSQYHTIPSALQALGETHVALVGRIETLSPPNQDFWYMALDPDGNIDALAAYDYRYLVGSDVKTGNGTGIAITPAAKDSLLLGGHLKTINDPNNLWLIEVAHDGGLRSHTRMGGAGNDQMTALQRLEAPSPDPTFALAGFTSSYSAGSFDMMVLKIRLVSQPGQFNKIGIDWAKAYKFQGVSYAYGVAQTTDGDLVVVGSAATPYTNTLDGVIIKQRSADGTVVWTNGYGSPVKGEGFYTVRPTPEDNAFVAAGYNTGFPVRTVVEPFTNQVTNQRNVWAMALDGLGHSPDDDTCVRLDLASAPHPFDWVPMCNKPPDPDVKRPELEAQSLEATESDLVLHARLICQ